MQAANEKYFRIGKNKSRCYNSGMKTQLKTHDIISAAARVVGVNVRTLSYALDRGEVDYQETPSGAKLVSLESAKKWAKAADQRRPGPKAKADAEVKP